MTVELVAPDELEGDESTPGIVRETVFRTENNVMVRSEIDAGTETGWHHHCDRHAYGYILAGEVVIEYGDEDPERREISAPMFFHIGPGKVHRETILPGEDAEVVVNFVGSGPLVENVEGPGGG